MDKPQIYLASRSPRRRTLIEQLGIRFQTLDVDVDEQAKEGESPENYVSRLALEKALCGWKALEENNVPVLGADTCIFLDGRIIGKVDSRERSIALLKKYSGSSHQVMTGIALVGQQIAGNRLAIKQEVRVSVSTITFRSLSDKECNLYWDTGEPAGKAGGYAIQGLAAGFVKKLDGSYSGVMGLPLCELTEVLAAFDIPWPGSLESNQ